MYRVFFPVIFSSVIPIPASTGELQTQLLENWGGEEKKHFSKACLEVFRICFSFLFSSELL